MSDKYIKVVMNKNNEIRLNNSKFTWNGILYDHINFKVDTGCPNTTIPIQKLGMSPTLAEMLKRMEVRSLIAKLNALVNQGNTKDEAIEKEKLKSFKVSYGVETGGTSHAPIDFFDEMSLMSCTAISFKNTISNITFEQISKKGIISSFDLPDTEIFINYDRKGNPLLGMDILSQMDVHIAKSKILNKTILLACPLDSLNDEYFKALDEHFELGDSIVATYI